MPTDHVRQEPLPRLRNKLGSLSGPQQAWRVSVQDDDGMVREARIEWRLIEIVPADAPDVEPLPLEAPA